MYFKNTLFSFLKLVFMCWFTKRTARVKDQVIFCFGLFVTFWFTVRVCIFRDHVISERIWVWLGDPVAALSLLSISTAGCGGLEPWPGSQTHAIRAALGVQGTPGQSGHPD